MRQNLSVLLESDGRVQLTYVALGGESGRVALSEKDPNILSKKQFTHGLFRKGTVAIFHL